MTIVDHATGEIVPSLSRVERAALVKCERAIQAGVESFAAAGEALARIRDDELYRETHSTFAAYVRERWNMTRDYAYKSIAAAEVKTILYTDRIQDQPLPQSEWQARPLAALLAPFGESMRQHGFWQLPEQQTARVTAPSGNGAAGSGYLGAAIANEVAAVRAADLGTRNDRLNTAAFNLGQLVGGAGLAEQLVVDELTRAALESGLTAPETVRTISSGLQAGVKQPRSVPVTVVAPAVVVLPPPELDTARIFGALPKLNWRDLWAADADDDDEWLVEPLIPAHGLVALYSPPKAGKSLLMLELAVGIATGRDVLGAKVSHPRRVLYVDMENDPKRDIRERLDAMGVGPEDLDNLVYLSFPVLAPLDTERGGAELLDHAGKDVTKGQRGGSAKSGDVDAVWRLVEVKPDAVYRLTCDGHRMPLPVTELLLHRETSPVLRHRVEDGGKEAIREAKVVAMLALLKGVIGEASMSRRQAAEALRAAGHGVDNVVLGLALSRRSQAFDPSDDTLKSGLTILTDHHLGNAGLDLSQPASDREL
jgi:hypothetical protein